MEEIREGKEDRRSSEGAREEKRGRKKERVEKGGERDREG